MAKPALDQLVEQLQQHAALIQAIAERAYGATAAIDMTLGRRRALDRVGMRAADLVAALTALADF